jgi:ribonuclease HI
VEKKMPKFYAVWNGRRRGVFDSWDACRESVGGFPGAKFKSFGSRARAEAELRGVIVLPPEIEDGRMALTVDGACSGTTGIGEYRGVLLPSRNEVFRGGPFSDATNNIMEYLAIIGGLRWMCRMGLRVLLYSDSRTAIAWVCDGERVCRSTRPPPPGSELAKEICQRTTWLRSAAETCGDGLMSHLRKWDTGALDEIPADFNRK